MAYFAFEFSLSSTITSEKNLSKVSDDNFELPTEPFKVYKEPIAEALKPKPNKSRALTTSVKIIDNTDEGESVIVDQPVNPCDEL